VGARHAGLESDPLSLNKEIDWVIKYHLIEQYRSGTGSR